MIDPSCDQGQFYVFNHDGSSKYLMMDEDDKSQNDLNLY